MRWVLAVVTGLVLAGMLWGSARPVAYACPCGSSLESQVGRVDLVVIASVTIVPPLRVPSEGFVEVEFELTVERYLKGTGPDRIVLSEPHQITGYDSLGRLTEGPTAAGCWTFGLVSERRRMLLLLQEDASKYQTGGCLRNMELHAVEGAESGDGMFYTRALAEYDTVLGLPQGTLERLANSPMPEDSTEPDFPALPAAALAVLGPLAFLAGAAFVWRRGG